ncbi:hypothetical protein DIPPA_00228 [Diplonema papillatum]|nr:hypothetical protein DIPPA_00228 [Diplonema papillatum]
MNSRTVLSRCLACRAAGRAGPLAAQGRRGSFTPEPEKQKVVTLDYRMLGLVYHKPTFAEVDSAAGLDNLKKLESQKRVVVIVYNEPDDAVVRRTVSDVSLEVHLAEVNDRILYVFAPAALDETLPCTPVIDVWAKGELAYRSLGRSAYTLRGMLPKLATDHAWEPLDADECWPSQSTFGIPHDQLLKVLKEISLVQPPDLQEALRKWRAKLFQPQ